MSFVPHFRRGSILVDSASWKQTNHDLIPTLAGMCGMSRVEFLFAAGRHGVTVADLSEEELADEFS
jgi:hypothetical protein